MAVVASGKPAISHYRVLQRFAGVTALEVSLESGRTHQIRVHMTHIGHPLVGDPVYGRPMKEAKKGKEACQQQLLDTVRSFPRQALHARTLTLVHPANSEEVTFEAPLPEDIRGLLAGLAAACP